MIECSIIDSLRFKEFRKIVQKRVAGGEKNRLGVQGAELNFGNHKPFGGNYGKISR